MVEHETWMREALKEAARGAEEGEVPIGAVIVHENRVIGRAHNQREQLKDPTAHAEMIAITQAAAALNNWRLTGATIYATMEPCVMCAGALVQARISRLVYGVDDPKAGGCRSLFEIGTDARLNHQMEIIPGVLEVESRELVQDFFRKPR